jgi:hypothetical protein
MAFVRCWRAGLLLSLFFAALSSACGGESDEVEQQAPQQEQAGEGPAGCYIEAERRCDCELDEAECTEDVGIWVDMGCGTCAT